jgi:hypothetical protein
MAGGLILFLLACGDCLDSSHPAIQPSSHPAIQPSSHPAYWALGSFFPTSTPDTQKRAYVCVLLIFIKATVSQHIII